MKSKHFIIRDDQVRKYVIEQLWQCDDDIEVVFRNATDKTLKQLGGIFGAWVKYIAEQGYSEQAIHTKWKREFLERIYKIEPLCPEQQVWVELDALYQEKGDLERYEINRHRISLSWAKLDQMRQYMNAIESHYISIGVPLPVLDKHYRMWRAA